METVTARITGIRYRGGHDKNNAEGRHAMERAHDGCGAEGQPRNCATDLEET